MTYRLPLDPPKQWGLTDDELAAWPLSFKEDALAGKVCVVSGGGSGIGRAIVYVLARLGAELVICGRRQDKLEETAAGIAKRFGKTVTAKAMTIREPEQVQALFAETWQRFGRLDVLVNSAGGQFPQAAIDFSVKGWNAVINTNLNGTWFMMQTAAQRWRQAGRAGNIVNIVVVTSHGLYGVAHTIAARAGVVALSRSVAVEWAPLGIRVNCIAPGSIETEGWKVYSAEARAAYPRSNPMLRAGTAWDMPKPACISAVRRPPSLRENC
jgi:citronellol/citronellal dehydrogenase